MSSFSNSYNSEAIEKAHLALVDGAGLIAVYDEANHTINYNTPTGIEGVARLIIPPGLISEVLERISGSYLVS